MSKREPRQASNDRQSEQEEQYEEITIERSARSRKSTKQIERVRVWWPPTKDKNRTGFSGAYWPANVQKKGANFLEVEYDNGERERVDPDNIFPFEVPIGFGKETVPLEIGEFVEVSNNSKTDPCAWLGCVATVGKKCLIDYPFHDSPSEYIKPPLLRRARVWDDLDWKYIEIGQQWKAGEVTSPIELNLLAEKEYMKQLSKVATTNQDRDETSDESEEENEDSQVAEDEDEQSEPAAVSSDEASEDQVVETRKQSSSRKRGKPRSSSQVGRSSQDRGSSGSADGKKADRPQGAKKRKPSRVRQA